MSKLSKRVSALVALLTAAALMAVPSAGAQDRRDRLPQSGGQFERIAHFPVFRNSSIEGETVAEIIDVTGDGNTLVYTDALLGVVGFIDITDPTSPQPGGTVSVGGDPTSVKIEGDWALVGVNTSPSFTNPSGHLAVIDITTRAQVATHPLAGQPDSIDVSPDGRYAAVVIENERDEDVVVDGVEGGLPQLPAGLLQIVDLVGAPTAWTVRSVALTGLSAYAPTDPEPEFVDINAAGQAVVSLQENNHVAVVDLRTGTVDRHFPAGEVTIHGVDASDDGRISFTESLTRTREPDAIHWASGDRIVTANEGDLFGGSRGFTMFSAGGAVLYDSGSEFEYLGARHGHYPDGRSDAKGTEPEGLEVARYGDNEYLFVASERGSFVGVYRLTSAAAPRFIQVLPAGAGPEGLVAIPGRNLLVVTSETDDPPLGLRTVVTIYRLQNGTATYPQIVSADDGNGAPIGWAALSGLGAHPTDPGTLYSVWDAAFSPDPRIFTVDVSRRPAVITRALPVSGAAATLDPEGIAAAGDGTFWLASEGNAGGSVPNQIVHIAADGSVLEEIGLPAEVLACRAASTSRVTLGSGFEGLTIGQDGRIYVAQQRGWNYTTPECEDLDDDHGGLNSLGEPLHTRIWVYDPTAGGWSWIPYELEDVPENALWVGLSEITALPDGRFALIERDNRYGPFTGLKALAAVSLAGPVSQGGKALRDIIPDLAAGNGAVLDKPEGFAVAADRQTYLVTDNDGVDGSTGETRFLNLGRWRQLFQSR